MGGKGKNKLPSGWTDYSKLGEQIPGTRFIPFKVPLREEILRSLPRDEWFTPADLIKKVPNLKLIVNLTNTTDGRYYYYNDFEDNGIELVNIQCQGRGVLPHEQNMRVFFNAVDNFMSGSDDTLIGVHCTHGLNRTGYFICRYMSERMSMPVNNAIKLFEESRGYKIDRESYTLDLQKRENNIPKKIFEESRGHKIVRETYITDLYQRENISKQHSDHRSNVAASRYYEAPRGSTHKQNSYNCERYRAVYRNSSQTFRNDLHRNNYQNNYRNSYYDYQDQLGYNNTSTYPANHNYGSNGRRNFTRGENTFGRGRYSSSYY